MELSNEFEVPRSIDEAWNVLTDVERIAPCLPGAQLQEIEDGEYRGVVKVKVGPITAQYKGSAHFVEKDDIGYRAVLTASGRDTRGQGNAIAAITAQLTENGSNTHVSLLTDLTVTGKVAQFGRGVMADVSNKLLAQFIHNLEESVLSEPNATFGAKDTSASSDATETKKVTQAGDAGATARLLAGGIARAWSDDDEPSMAVTREPLAPRPDLLPPADASTTESTSSNGGGRNIRKVNVPDAEPVDLFEAAGASLLKRLVPIVGLAVALVIIILLRRRR